MSGALLLLASGSWLIVSYYGGWEFLEVPWLTGMVILYALEVIEGNTITRLYFMPAATLGPSGARRGAGHSTTYPRACKTVSVFHALSGHPTLVGDRLSRRAAPK